MLSIFAQAGIPEPRLLTLEGAARFPSIESWIHTDVKGWTLADLIDEAQYQRLQREAQRALAHFTQADGSVAFPAPAHIVTAAKP